MKKKNIGGGASVRGIVASSAVQCVWCAAKWARGEAGLKMKLTALANLNG